MSADMNASTFRTKTSDELLQSLSDLKREYLNLRFQKVTGQLEAPSRIRIIRRAIARVKTILTEKNNQVGKNSHE